MRRKRSRAGISLKLASLVAGIVVSMSGGASALAPGCPGLVRQSGLAMGTRVTIAVCPLGAGPQGEARAREAARSAFGEFGRLENLWTIWRPASDVSRINAAAGKGPVKVAPETIAVLQASLAGSRLTHGIFDITFWAVGQLWNFETPPGSRAPPALERIPTAAEVRARLKLVGWRHLHVDSRRRTAFLDRAGMRIDLGGIGKGAAVDRAVAMLRASGYRDFVVQAGGDLYCAGKNGRRPWMVGIQHPRKKGAILGRVRVTDAAFSTSGDYEHFVIVNGVRYHHLIDLRTGFPARASESATVLVSTATEAEVLDKWAFVLGGRRALAALASVHAKGFLADGHGRIWQSPGLRVLPP